MPQDLHHDNRWKILVAVSLAQLMVVLDATITSIALPSAQIDLHFGSDSRQWIITAYALAFGSLLLVGGRLGDLIGRKRTFVGGLLGFGIASAAGGAAGSFGVLVAARAAQGLSAAVLAPAALALLATSFADEHERRRAFAVFGSVASAGSAIGILLGGALTQWLSWRSCLYVTLVVAVPVALASSRLLVTRRPTSRPVIDLPGAASVTSGAFLLVYGLANAERTSWSDPVTVVALGIAAFLLAVFVLVERRVEHPLLPLRILTEPTRGGAFVAVAVAGSAIFAAFLFLTFYLQQTKGYPPIRTGLAFLPLPLTIMTLAPRVNTVLLPRFGPRNLIVSGLAAGAVAMLWFTQLTPTSAYAPVVLPGLVLLGVAMAFTMAPAFATATSGVDAADAGVASATVNMMQQLGGAAGTALLSSAAASATDAYLGDRRPTASVIAAASVHGYSVAFLVASALFLAGAAAVATLMRPRRASTSRTGEDRDAAVRHRGLRAG